MAHLTQAHNKKTSDGMALSGGQLGDWQAVFLALLPMATFGACVYTILWDPLPIRDRFELAFGVAFVGVTCSVALALLFFLARGHTVTVEALWGVLGGGVRGYRLSPTSSLLVVLLVLILSFFATVYWISGRTGVDQPKKLTTQTTQYL